MYIKDINGYTVSVFPHLRGYYCGYVKIPMGHPLHSVRHFDIDIKVHGGWTRGVLEDDGTWEISFDTNHPGDEEAGWTIEKVFEELESVVKQLGPYWTFDW